MSRKFILLTKSESCGDYHYFIKHDSVPTNDELESFLIIHANDMFVENIEKIIEIKYNTKFLPIPL